MLALVRETQVKHKKVLGIVFGEVQKGELNSQIAGHYGITFKNW